MTHPEQATKGILESIGFEVKHYKQRSDIDRLNVFYFQTSFDSVFLDFALPHAQIAIEVNGDYWHANHTTTISAIQLKSKLNDANKRFKLESDNWKLIVVSESLLASPMRAKQYIESSILDSFEV